MKINLNDTVAAIEATVSEPVAKKLRRIRARTNRKPKLVELGLMKAHNFMSSTEATQTTIYPMIPVGGSTYEVANDPCAVSVILKLVLSSEQTNAMSMDWSTILWNVTQVNDRLPSDCLVTFTRHFERVDDELATKNIKNRMRLAVVSSDSAKNQRRQGKFVRHDQDLLEAIATSDSVVAFGAEAIITAPNMQKLEKAMEIVQYHLRANDETRGLSYELDLNRQLNPFVLYGPNKVSKNKDVYVEMTSEDAAISALFVDSGGDREAGSEYIGLSVGKMIQSHAAYALRHGRMLVVGNDTVNQTYTLLDSMPANLRALPSQLYWSYAMSRAYLLENQSVTHFVLDHMGAVDHLMDFPLASNNKISIDVAKGLLNILEVVGSSDWKSHPERIVGRFATHLNNVIALLSQYRDVERISTTDNFASITRTILTDFFVVNKYYHNSPLEHLDDIRLIGRHDQYKTLADLGSWIAQRRKSNRDSYIAEALAELDLIVNEHILPTVPALNRKTDPVIDVFVDKPYRVLDLTGMSVGAIANTGDSTTNVMMISYLNLLLPALKNGDAIFIHGLSRIEKIADVVQDMVANSGKRVDVIFTESNQNAAMKTIAMVKDSFDLSVVDLYNNKIDKLYDTLRIDEYYAKQLEDRKSAFYLRTKQSSDYIYLDNIL